MLTDQERKDLMHQLISSKEERRAIYEKEPPENEVFDIHQDPYMHMMRMIFSRWKPFILQAIYFDEGTYFSKFFKQLPISQKVLSQNLKELQDDGLIYREVIPEVPPRVVYHLTETGYGVIALLELIYDWGWVDMQKKNLPIDILGEMWHGYRELDEELMDEPFSTKKKK